MKCSICKNVFITTRNIKDYNIKKGEIDEELSKFIDTNIERDEISCWKKILISEALLLKPNQQPIKIGEHIICKYCYQL